MTQFWSSVGALWVLIIVIYLGVMSTVSLLLTAFVEQRRSIWSILFGIAVFAMGLSVSIVTLSHVWHVWRIL